MSKVREIMARRAAGEKGFTLVELLVVVVILVVLAAIAVPIFLNQAGKAKIASAKNNVATAASALKNGAGTEGTFAYTQATKTIVVTDGTGATTTVALGNAGLYNGAVLVAADVASSPLSGGSAYAWCIGQSTGSTPADVSQTVAQVAPAESACA